jgi:cytochrome c oxidase cbb3-type subunit I
MTLGEGGLALFFAALAFASIMAAGKADDAPFAFHAFLAAAASAASVFAIVNRYCSRPIDLPPKEIDGKPNYHMQPPNRCRFCCGA